MREPVQHCSFCQAGFFVTANRLKHERKCRKNRNVAKSKQLCAALTDCVATMSTLPGCCPFCHSVLPNHRDGCQIDELLNHMENILSNYRKTPRLQGKHVALVRKRLGIKQKELEQMLGCTSTRVCYWEANPESKLKWEFSKALWEIIYKHKINPNDVNKA